MHPWFYIDIHKRFVKTVIRSLYDGHAEIEWERVRRFIVVGVQLAILYQQHQACGLARSAVTSPVRMRTTSSSVVTNILPSPISPVRAPCTMASSIPET